MTFTRQSQAYEILKTARDIISSPAYWVKGFAATNKKGEQVAYHSLRAECFCSYGAILRATLEVGLQDGTPAFSEAFVLFKRSIIRSNGLTYEGVGHWNDNTTHDKVMEVFDNAISDAKLKMQLSQDKLK